MKLGVESVLQLYICMYRIFRDIVYVRASPGTYGNDETCLEKINIILDCLSLKGFAICQKLETGISCSGWVFSNFLRRSIADSFPDWIYCN